MMMTDYLTVQFSLSVDTLLNVIGGAMIVVTVVVFSVMGKIKYLNFICPANDQPLLIVQFCVSSTHVLFTPIVQGFGKKGK